MQPNDVPPSAQSFGQVHGQTTGGFNENQYTRAADGKLNAPLIGTPTLNSTQSRSKLAAGILGICLGSFGVHNFYLGFTNKGITQLLMSVLSLGILTPVTAVWGIVDGVMILTDEHPLDADGKLLRD